MSLDGVNISTAEVSDVLGITPSSVHRLVREGFMEVKDTKQYKSGLEAYFDWRSKQTFTHDACAAKKMAAGRRQPSWSNEGCI